MMHPSLDQLIQITRTLAHDSEFVRVVLVSTEGDTQTDAHGEVQFIEVSDGPEFRTDLQQALRDGLTALGLLGWELKEVVRYPWSPILAGVSWSELELDSRGHTLGTTPGR